MGEIVTAISSLCNVLESVISIPLKPEFFRLSKLNKLNTEEISLLWEVLHKLCCFPTTVTCKNEAKKCVSDYLLKRGGVVAYALTPDCSARQLLLCLAWLLSHGAIEAILDQLMLDSPLNGEFPNNLDKPTYPESLTRPSGDDFKTRLNYALFLIEQIHHNLRAIANYHQERTQLCAKIHKVTAGYRGLPHLSAGDVQLLTSPQLLPNFLAQCRPYVNALDAYSRWQRKSHVFWQWMDKILKEEEESESKKVLSVEELSHLNAFLKQLEDSVRKTVMTESRRASNKKYIPHFTTRRLCRNNVAINFDSIINDLDKEISTLTLLIKRKKEELMCGELSDEAIHIIRMLDCCSFSVRTTAIAESHPPNNR